MKSETASPIANVIGRIPNRIALAGGWIDQPFVSRHNPRPPGSMVVVSLEPKFRPMDRAGFAGGTREVALRLWKGRLPRRPAAELVRELYAAENRGKAEPSGSQDMIGLIYPGISKLDYDFGANGGVFPSHIESLNSSRITSWLESVLHVLPIEARPPGYNPLGKKNLHPEWIARLGETGRQCFEAIRRTDLDALGRSMNDCMRCWETILPHTLAHPTIKLDLKAILRGYQRHYPGAMYSGCGGGYLFVVSNKPVPGALKVNVRTAHAGGVAAQRSFGARKRGASRSGTAATQMSYRQGSTGWRAEAGSPKQADEKPLTWNRRGGRSGGEVEHREGRTG